MKLKGQIMIEAHLYARHHETVVYFGPDHAAPMASVLGKGDWVGVTHRMGTDWLRIVSTTCDGWVKSADVESRPPLQLHARWTPGNPIQYVNSK